VASLGTLNLVLSADSSPLRKELSGVTREAQFAAKAIQGISTGESFSGAGLQVLSSTIIGLVDDTHRLSNEFKLTTSLVENLKNGIGGLAALPIPDFQAEALSSLGLGQVSSSLEVLSLASTGLKTLAIAQGIAQNAIVAFSGALETLRVNLKLVSYFFEDIGNSLRAAGAMFAPLVGLMDGAGRAFDRLSDGAGDVKGRMDSAWVSVGSFGQQLQKYIGAAEKFQSAMEDLGEAAIFFNQWQNLNDIFDGVFGGLQENFDAARNFETLNNRLQLTSTSAGGAREDLAFLRQTAKDLGLDFKAVSEGFAQFSAAAKLAGYSADQTKQVFTDVSQAASVMGLSAEDTSGLFLALRQSLSGGTVQLEELNQLAERVPGAFDAAAQALGVTTGEVKGLISAGDVASAEFIPKFAAALASVTESGVTDAMTSGTAAVNRFNNALGEVSVSLGKDLLSFGTPAINAFAKVLEFGAQNAEIFGTAIDALLVAAAIRGAGAVGKMGSVIASFVAQGGKGSIAMQLFGQQISLTTAQIGKLAAQAGLTFAALTVFYKVLDRFKEGGEEARSSITSLERSLEKLNEVTRNATPVASIFPKDPPPLDWVDKAVASFNRFNEALNNSVGLPEDFLSLDTNADKQLNDQLIAIGEFGQKAQEILGQSLSLREATRGGDGAINDLKEIDMMLAQIEQRKLQIDPGNADALAEIRQEEEALLQRRGDTQKQIQQTQSALNNAIAQTKQQLQSLDPAQMGQEGYNNAKTQLEAQLKLLEREETALNAVANTTTKVAENAVTDFQKSNHEIEASYNQRQAAIAESLAKNEITEEQSREQSLQAEQEYLQKRLELNQSLLEKLRTELEKNQQLKLRDPDDAILTADQEKQYAEQVKQLELETAQTRIQIAQNTREGKQQALEDELKGIEQANSEAEAAVRQSQSERTAAIRQQQLAGTVGEEEAAARIAEIQRDSIAEQIDLERDKLAQLAELEAAGTIPAEEAAKRRLDIQSEISDLSLQQIEAELDARLEAERKAADEAKELRDSVNVDATRETTQVRVRQVGGEINEAEAAAEIAEITANATARQIELVEQRLGVVRRGSDEEKDLTRELADLQQQSAEQEIARQEQVKQARLEALERANQQAEAAIEQSQTAEITAVRQLQAQRIITAEDAEARIATIQQRGLDQQFAQAQQQIAEVSQLRAEGILSEEDASDRLLELNGQLGALNQQRVEAEIAAQERLRQVRIDSINQELETARTTSEVQQGLNQIQSDSLANQNNLLSARSNLIQAQSGLIQQRLGYALEEAEAAGNTSQAESLRRRIIQEQITTQEAQFVIAQQQLDLQQQQNALALENQRIQAGIAMTEAEIALRIAEVNGADQQVIDGLREILGLRGQQLTAIEEQAIAQERANDAAQDALSLEQQAQRESLRRRRALEAADPTAAAGQTGSNVGTGGFSSSGSRGGSTGSGSGARSSGSGASSGSGGSIGGGAGQALTAIGNEAVGQLDRAVGILSSGFADASGRILNRTSEILGRLQTGTNNPYAEAAIAASGRSDTLRLQELSRTGFQGNLQASRIAAAVDQGAISSNQVGEIVDRLLQGMNRIALAPRAVTLNTPDPIRDFQRISSDLMSSRASAAGI